MAVVVGIVRRSTSNSGEFELLPRSPLDLHLGPSLSSPAVQRAAGTTRPSAATAIAARENISTLPTRLGQPVIVSGLVVDSESGSATVDDGTGRVRIGGSAAAEAISLLEPGDAIEVGGLVRQDAQGWLIDADPASIVALSAAGEAPTTAADATTALAPAIASRPADRAATLEPGPLASSSTWLAASLIMALVLLATALAGAYAIRRRGWRPGLPTGFRGPRPDAGRASDEPGDAF